MTHDFVAIGLGPFNLGLACLTDPLRDSDGIDGVFLEARDRFAWHPGMLLDDATLQVPFLADLVTMADPTSRWSFLNYLKQSGNLYPFYIRESFYPLRREYDDYCRWAAERLPSVRFGQQVTAVEHDGSAYRVTTSAGETFGARHLVVGVGTAPHVPAALQPVAALPQATHTADYLAHRTALQEKERITIVGSGQSAAEVYYDLLATAPDHGYELVWLTRSPRFFPMEYTKLTLEMTSPEYAAHHRALPMATRDRLVREQRHLFKGISGDLVDAIFDLHYQQRVTGDGPRTTLLTNTEVRGSRVVDGGAVLDLEHLETGEAFSIETGGLVLATGYAPTQPAFLEGIEARIRRDARGRYDVAENYSVDVTGGEVFVQNAEEHTHSLLAPDLGMGAYRNSVIIAAMLGREVYPVEKRIAVQTSACPTGSVFPSPRGTCDDSPHDVLSLLHCAPPEHNIAGTPMSRSFPGRITIEPLDVERDLDLLHEWVRHPRSSYWMMLDATRADVRAEYASIAAKSHHDAWLGRVDGRALFLAETYDPRHAEGLAGLPELEPGDLGMHVLVAPPDGDPEPGLTTAVFDAVLAFCFADSQVRRIVVEPDVRNAPIRAKNIAAGFTELREIPLHGKTAVLSMCPRADWDPPKLAIVAGEKHREPADGGAFRLPLSSGEHLTPVLMEQAQRHLVAKALGEFAHERMIAPVAVPDDHDRWRVATDRSAYTFTARVKRLEHWVVDPASIERVLDGEQAVPDAQELISELAPALGIPDRLLPTYLEEVAATLAAAAWKLAYRAVPVADLVDADYQHIESAMTEGHPAFVANNGRVGFGLDDYAAYAPETGSVVRLHWVAARRSLTHLALGEGETEQSLYDGELSAPMREEFAHRLCALGLAPEDYLYLPVHPWQWRNKLSITFAPDLARHDLVHLGEGHDDHRPQQSIRTFFNASRPERHYVKTALAIQNMGFVRGLSPAYMEATPAINDWVASIVHGDVELQRCGFAVLREVAAIGYTGDAYHRLASSSPYRKMIAALWRESPVPRADAGEQVTTMAALLHRDSVGDALITAWLKASPIDAADWVRAWLRAYLRPLVHCLYVYDLAFMPHGENVLLRLRDHVPVGAFMKDIGEEVAVMGGRPLPADVERIRVDFPDDVKALAVHTDVFDGVLRFVAAILDEDGMLAQDEFWALVRETIEQHAADHPDLAEAAARYDLLRPRFRHSCLNRLQLRNTVQMVDLADQAESLIFAGTLANPAAR